MRTAAALLLGVVCVAVSASAQKTVPFTLENNCIFLYCKINDTDSLKFLFDTGADGSVINRDSPKATAVVADGKSVNTGSNGTNEVSTSSGNRVSFSGITREPVSLMIIPFGTTDFDGVFGTNLMNQHVIQIDYDHRVLKFYEPADLKWSAGEYDKLKIHYVGTYPTISCSMRIQNKTYSGYFGLDSGASDALTVASPYVRKHSLKNKTTQIASATFQGSDGSVYEMPIVSCPELSLGKKTFYAIPVNLSDAKEGIDASEDMAGFFGNNFLKRFNMILDLKNGFIYLKPNENLYTPFFN